MSEHHTIDLNLNFSFEFKSPLKLVIKLDTDAAEAQCLADQLKTASSELAKTVKENQPKT